MCTCPYSSRLVAINGNLLKKALSACQQLQTIYLLQDQNTTLLKVRLAQNLAMNASLNAAGTCGILHKHLSRAISCKVTSSQCCRP